MLCIDNGLMVDKMISKHYLSQFILHGAANAGRYAAAHVKVSMLTGFKPILS
jgi:hypothetical protein